MKGARDGAQERCEEPILFMDLALACGLTDRTLVPSCLPHVLRPFIALGVAGVGAAGSACHTAASVGVSSSASSSSVALSSEEIHADEVR